MRTNRPGIPPLAKEVLSYFLRNPQAADDLEGVARWRAPQEAIHFTVDQVANALGWLVQEGFLVEECSPGVSTIFHLNQERHRDAELFIAERLKRTYADPDAAPVRESRLMAPAMAWLSAVLIRHLRENPPRGSDQPGLTRSHESIEALLAGPVGNTPDSVSAARGIADKAGKALKEACEEPAIDEPLAALYRGLGLTWLEFEAVLLCLAPELDARFQAAYAVLNDDMGRRTPTLGLICRILGDSLAIRTELAASAGLTRWRLLDSGASFPHADEPLRMDVPILSWVLGSDDSLLTDVRMLPVLRLDEWPGGAWLRLPSDLLLVERLARRFASDEHGHRWLALCGEDVDGWRALAEAIADRVGMRLIRVLPGIGQGPEALDWDDTAARVTRAVLLLDAAAVLDFEAANAEGEGAAGRSARLVYALTRVGRPGVLIAADLERVLAAVPREGCDVFRRDQPPAAVVAAAYLAAASDAGLELSPVEADQLAMAFPLPVSGIDSAVRLAVLQGADRQLPDRHYAAIAAACRKVASPELPRYARRVIPTFRLEDVVLPKDRLEQLWEMVAHVKYASQVLNKWGFAEQLPYGRGVAALFSGPSGTGKTMAAQAIAHELRTEAYVVDLSRVVSKYIGETEKFIDATFRDAQRAGAVLQIDEAEALFGKRSEIKDAHDRYANIEVAYLLQRMEAYDGAAILTTNQRQSLDQAFLRRLRFVIDFPKPDAAARESIWLRCLPKEAPFYGIDVRFLARRLELTGGHIRQITVRAAFLAAGEGSPLIEMRHLIAASRAELLKLGMPGAERELAEFEAQRNSERVA